MRATCGAHSLCRRSVQALALLAAASLCAGYIEPSTSPPGGLDPYNTPMFILLTHDDAIYSSTHKLMKSVTDGRSFNGCPAAATMFVTTQIGNDCELTMDLYDSGYEIADHTQTHSSLRGMRKNQLEKEIVGARSDLDACGVPSSDVVGLRAPYLETDVAVREVLHRNGFLYESTLIEEGSGASLSGGMDSRVWPFQMDEGVPMNCDWFSSFQTCTTTESWPGMFQVPVWHVRNGEEVWSMDYGINPSKNVYRILKDAFDAAYNGNRAPLPIFIHTPWLEDYANDVNRFLDEVQGYPDVYMVTIRQLLGWMEDPVPADQLSPEVLGCGNPGGAPGTGSAGVGAGSDGASDSGAPAPATPEPEEANGVDDADEEIVQEGAPGINGGTESSSGPGQSSSVAAAFAAAGYRVRRLKLQ